jgi:hypothetical protein
MLPHRAVAQVIKCPAQPPADLWESSGGSSVFQTLGFLWLAVFQVWNPDPKEKVMRNTLLSSRPVLFSFVLILTLLTSPTLADAAWYCAQGNVSVIQNPDATDSLTYYGWGPDFTAKSSSTNWVHIPIPGPGDTDRGARYIRIKIYTGSVDVWFSEVHAYNGANKVYNTTGSWSNGNKTIDIDLGSVKKFDRGLSVSLKVDAGVESMSHRVYIPGACANFVTIK